jgi:hypothetical protein
VQRIDNNRSSRWGIWRFVLILAVCAAGCGRRTFGDYVPNSQQGRVALDAALGAWVAGQTPDKINASVELRVVDSQWKAGTRLGAYEILREETTGELGPKVFSVRLTLDGPNSAQEVRYVVLGRSPFWVFWEEDYRRIAGWEHGSKKSAHH